jgi:hypothetical protein
MAENQYKNLFNGQFTIRLSDDEVSYINENFAKVAGDDYDITRSRFFIDAVKKAVQNVSPKEKIVKDPDDQRQIEILSQTVNEQQEFITKLEAQLKEARESSSQQIPKGAIVLNFEPKIRHYFWGLNEMCKKLNYSKTYEEMIEKMLVIFHKRDEFKLTEEDIKYLNTLEYDGN